MFPTVLLNSKRADSLIKFMSFTCSGIALYLLMGFVPGANAQPIEQERPILRVRVEPRAVVIVGQPLKVTVDILVPTWFTRAPQFPQLEIPGAIAILPEERPVNLIERIRGTSWSGLSRSYLIYPQEAREYILPPAELVVVYATGGGNSSPPIRLPLPPHRFEARIPPEASGLDYFISTTHLRLRQEFDRPLAGLKVGDAIRRTITMTAENTFAMFLPPITFEADSGLAVYPDPSRVSERKTDRGGLERGIRVESATYVIQEAGRYELPELKISWWDLSRGTMRQTVVPAVTFNAEANPDYIAELPFTNEDESETLVSEVRKSPLQVIKEWTIPGIVVLTLLFVLLRLRQDAVRRFRLWRQETQRRRRESEAVFFVRFRKACKANDPFGSFRHLMVWIDRFHSDSGGMTLEQFLKDINDPELAKQVHRLENFLFAERPNRTSWSGRNLYREVVNARGLVRHDLRSTHQKKGDALTSLNPTVTKS